MNSTSRLLSHYLLVFGLVPLGLFFLRPHGFIYIVLWVMAFVAWRTLHKKHGYDLRRDWNLAALDRAAVRRIVLRFLPFAAALLIFAALAIPEHFFSLPLKKPTTWVMVMLLYPLLSVFPQEILFRSFFFRYYAPWLTTPRAMLLVNSLAFGWVHIVLHNWVAVTFSFIGSLMFADTYRRTNSLAAVCFEHALYGCFIFTIGLGFFFYHGMAVR